MTTSALPINIARYRAQSPRARRRVLIVVSTYAPAMIADMHRARMLAWELPALGWDVEVLAPDVAFQHPSCVEADSGQFFPSSQVVHRVAESGGAFFRAATMRSIGWRSLWPMYRRGLSLLRSNRFDLVFFTTTQFNLFLLGPLWQARTGVPYVLDFHDPWYRPGVHHRTTPHVVKLRLSRTLARHLEPIAVRRAAGVMTVSPAYLETLANRYTLDAPRWIRSGRNATIPFAAREADLAGSMPNTIKSQPSHASERTPLRLVYVGAGGAIMECSFASLCDALALLRDDGDPLALRVRIELHGTTYGWRDTGDRPFLERVAAERGLSSVVVEHPGRVSYARSLDLLRSADGALVLGVDDSGYMPSKLFTYALSGLPLIASLRAGSPAWELVRREPAIARLMTFGLRHSAVSENARALGAQLSDMAVARRRDRRASLEPYLAPAMASRVADLFSACLADADLAASS